MKLHYEKSKTAGANATGEGMSKLESQVVNGKVVDIHGSWRNSGRKLQPGLESPHLLSIGDRHNRGYRLTALQLQTVRRTVGLPRTLFLTLSLPPSPFPPSLPVSLGCCESAAEFHIAIAVLVPANPFIPSYLSQVHVLREAHYCYSCSSDGRRGGARLVLRCSHK